LNSTPFFEVILLTLLEVIAGFLLLTRSAGASRLNHVSGVLLFAESQWGTGWIVLLSLLGLAAISLGLMVWRPDRFVRLAAWIPVHLFYRVRVYGAEVIPAQGPVLFVCNHVSYIDAFLVFLAQKRPIRFVMWAPYLRLPGLRILLRLAQVIPIDASSGPRAIVQSLRMAGEALAKGDAVCIFAEGGITRTGFMLPFHRGFEQILKRTPATVVPICLDHVWGSIFSFRGGKVLWKWPQKLPYPVRIAFGQPMPSTVTAVEVRQAIQKLSADCSIAAASKRRPVHRQFIRMAARHPFRTCIIDSNTKKVFRCGEVLAAAMILAKKLRALLADTPMVGIWLPPSPGGAFANIALAILGKISVNLNYTSSPEGVRSAIKQCGIRHVLTARLFTSKMKLDPGPDVELVYLEDFRKEVTSLQRLRAFLTVLLLPAFVLDRWVLRLGKHTSEDLATVIFSSGSTGEPKGVMLSHRNLAANVESVIQAIDVGPKDRLLGILPLFHSFGYTVTIWVPLLVGASVVFYPDPRQAVEIGQLCRTYRCTLFMSTATFLRFCLRRCEPGDFSSVRFLICGAEKLPQSLAQEFHEKFGVMPLEGYGCTELSPVAATNVPDWSGAGARQLGNKPGTIGRPIPGVAARIVDPDSFEPLPAEKEGLLLIYGGNVMMGYLGKPEDTRRAIRDGWYVTGDMGKFDADGFITLTGRQARFAKIGGEMVPLERIEEELNAILGVVDRMCAVTSVPDDKKGERVVVLHLPLNGMDIRQLCQNLSRRGLPNLGLPGERDFFLIPEMPVLGSGKLDLKRVKEMALERIGKN
jgi:acyl-[acyl-carrier-protein]-phospholipid O-acyltransferase/long-chain-fatty-acid--[acyl-carrier-protein] ligase